MTIPSLEPYLAGLPRKGSETDRAVVPALRAYLADVRAHLEALHGAGAGGAAVNERHSDLLDRLVRRLFVMAEDRALAEGGEIDGSLCVMAVGGYARREMSIFSDVDILFLYRKKLTPYITSVAERMQYWLWDAGLTVGSATRTIADTVKMGHDDATVRTAVLSARYIAGDGEFFHEFSDTIRAKLLPDPAAFVAEQQRGLAERHRRFGESLYLLQPNVKEGAGGLRDWHTAYWCARATQPSTRGLDDLLHFGLLTESEMDEFRAALEFVWNVRNDLHLVSKRANEQMSFDLQEQIAERLGYRSDDDDSIDLPVERFMRDWYRHARAIQNYSELVIEQCGARVSRRRRRRNVREVDEGFRLADGQLEIPHAAHLRERPERLLRVFEVAATLDVPLSRIAQRLVRENLDLIDDDFRRDPANGQTLERLLGARYRVMRTLMTMNEVGVLGAYMPEWSHVVCRWQHIMYHTYTVDVHSIFLVEHLRRLWKREYEAKLPDLTELVHAVVDWPVLFLGCLLHDIGKGLGGDHSSKGADLARGCCERLGMDAERVERIVFLVKYHLLMSHLAQRRDLSDPNLILEFARVCGDRKNLRNLYLVTFADIRASSADAWTDWKGQLLRELFERTAELLEVGSDDPGKAMELIEARVERRRESARAELVGLGLSEEQILSYFESLPHRYFISHGPRQIARHARVVLGYELGRPFALSVREMKGGFSELIVCAPDVHGLYAKVAGTLTASRLNILGSHVYTTRDELALEIYRVTTPDGGAEERDATWRDFESSLARALRGEVEVEDLVRRRRVRMGGRRLRSSKPPTVVLSNSESDFYTIADVTTDDRLGLLYDLTETIARHGLEVYISKAATILDQVADTFYLKDAKGMKVLDPELLEALRRDLLEAAQRREDEERA